MANAKKASTGPLEAGGPQQPDEYLYQIDGDLPHDRCALVGSFFWASRRDQAVDRLVLEGHPEVYGHVIDVLDDQKNLLVRMYRAHESSFLRVVPLARAVDWAFHDNLRELADFVREFIGEEVFAGTYLSQFATPAAEGRA